MLIGIVGKPNVGKSTFFKALTLMDIFIANFPFATIKPNHGAASVRVECVDKEFGKQCTPRMGTCVNGIRYVPVDLMDVAGLVPGAYKGLGLGNQFLNDLNMADALVHVVDISGSTNEKGEPVPAGSYDPADDVRFLETELDMWYLGLIKTGWEKFARTVMQTKADISKSVAKQLSGLRVTEDMVVDAIKNLKLPEEIMSWKEVELLKLAAELRKKTKPIIIAANKCDMPNAELNFQRVKQLFPEYKIIPCSAESELALKEAAKNNLIKYYPGEPKFEIIGSLNERQLQGLEFINENILKKYGATGVQGVLDYAVFELLEYIAIFPGGVNKLTDSQGRTLPDCFLMPENSTAIDFAYRLHTDFGKNFIKAIDVRTKMAVGKGHQLKHRDVIEIAAGK